MAQQLSRVSDKVNYTFLPLDDSIHGCAIETFLGQDVRETVFKQRQFAYKAQGGEGGYLCYKSGVNGDWILLADWYSYGLFLTVRYRKSPWLRIFYEKLFEKMEFFSVDYCSDGFELVRIDGSILKGRKLNLSPPGYLEKYLSDNFRLRPTEVGKIRSKLNIQWVL
jgi:hypothetical protein